MGRRASGRRGNACGKGTPEPGGNGSASAGLTRNVVVVLSNSCNQSYSKYRRNHLVQTRGDETGTDRAPTVGEKVNSHRAAIIQSNAAAYMGLEAVRSNCSTRRDSHSDGQKRPKFYIQNANLSSCFGDISWFLSVIVIQKKSTTARPVALDRSRNSTECLLVRTCYKNKFYFLFF